MLIALFGSFALTVGIHLIIDIFQKKAIIFPNGKSLLKGTYIDDIIWLILNAALSLFISLKIYLKSIIILKTK